jgi:molecular chaperone GrpE
LLRLQAEFDNFRKRTERESKERAIRSSERLMQKLLPTLDHFQLGLASATPEDPAGPLIDGMKLVLAELQSVLGAEGLQPIDAEGLPFDPQVHEAVAVVPSPDHPDGTVLRQVRRGYRLGQHLLRPASVVVSRDETHEQPQGPDDEKIEIQDH